MRLVPLFAAISGVFGHAVFADGSAELSFYGSASVASDAAVSGSDPGGAGNFSLTTGWSSPATQGLRLTVWPTNRFGWGLDFHSGTAIADDLSGAGIDELAFENGLSLLTLNAFHRSQSTLGGWQPYVGAGMGVSIPTVRFDGGGTSTSSQQLTGPAVQFMAGARLPISDDLSLFGEYQGSYSVNVADLASGGTVDADLLTNGINVGISLGF